MVYAVFMWIWYLHGNKHKMVYWTSFPQQFYDLFKMISLSYDESTFCKDHIGLYFCKIGPEMEDLWPFEFSGGSMKNWFSYGVNMAAEYCHASQ